MLLMLQDYIFCRLMRSGLLAEGSSYSADTAQSNMSDVSRELQLIGARLETMYPNLYQNVSRQVNISLKVFDAIKHDKNLEYCTDFEVQFPAVLKKVKKVKASHTRY